VMLRQIPMDKRSYVTFDVADWDLFAEHISSALERFLAQMSKDLGKLHQEGLPEGLKVDASDLFDGRMYRHVFQFAVEKGLAESGGQVAAEFFRLQEWIAAELEFLWAETGSKEKFFPIAMSAVLKLPGIAPPAPPAKEKPRQKPEIKDIKSDFCANLWQDREFSNISLLEQADVSIERDVAWTKYSWYENHVFLDDVKRMEEMEKNEGEKKMEEKMKAKGKLTARDLDFQRKFQMKKRQMALKALHAYSKSLSGSDKLHNPIIMKDDEKDKDKDKDKDKKDKDKDKDTDEKGAAKVSKKHLELLEKRKLEEEEKIKEFDRQQLKLWEPKVEAWAEVMDLEKLENQILDTLLGFGRITDSFVGFPALSSAFKTPDAQVKVLVKAFKALRTSLKKMQLDKLPSESQPKVRQMVVYLFCMVQEAFNSFGKDFDGKGIKLLQEVLLSIGFPKIAESLFEKWLSSQNEATSEAAAPEKGKEGKDDKKKGGKDKDDKKKGKDDKKDDKKDSKDDKKKKKDGKDAEPSAAAAADKDPSQFRVTKDVDLCWSGVGEDEHAFQLMHMGRYMTRTVGTGKDPKKRVNFKPDRWQRDLLDIVDDERSALVVAPTASGKTFIGYYVMDRVLRADNDGVAVYVAPSKALVNQVSAEIYARFSSKTYPAHSKSELLGVFLKEFNSAGGVMEAGKWRNCQVLVTIPHVLEMLLLSPSAQDWVKRLRWVVFDEVHCIGEQEGGAQWEHSMQLIPCPFIALSATVADPSFFHNWLGKVNEKKKGSKVELVVHTERWNDLYKFVWAGSELRPLHPFCCLIEQSVRKNGLTSDLTLTPQEMIQLFLEVKGVIGKVKEWDRLSPKKYFAAKERGFITKLDARQYERELKEAFLQLLKDGILTGDGFTKLTLALQQPPASSGAARAEPKFSPPPRTGEADAEAAASAPEGVGDLSKMNKGTSYLQAATLFSLCRSLDKVECLPAIFFNFSRKEIERMLQKLVQELKDQQTQKYYGTEEAAYRSKKIMEKRNADYKAKKEAYDQAQKMRASKKQEATAARKDGEGEGRGANKGEAVDVSEDMAMAEPEPVVDLADEIDMDFSFHSPKALGQWQEDIEEQLKELKWKGTPDFLIDGLRRGIGMHHEGCRTNYRRTVEILFRRGYLRVVFATGTLALGINMPCRTTIFCGDSLELNGLMFRQMSGRAGRRGFDLLGQVVFLDMAFLKVQRLIASDLTSLTGEFTLSPSSLLRALLQWERVTLDLDQEKALPRSKAEIAETLVPMFSLPFFQSKTADLETQVAYQTRFSLEFLHREGLVGTSGGTRNLANMVTFLFDIEPANFMLNRLFSKGLLHKFLIAEAKRVKKGDRKSHLTVRLTSVLAWLLYPRRLPNSIPKERAPRKNHLPSDACPKLPSLPKPILEEVKKYNASVFGLFQDLAWVVASTRKVGEPDLALPLSDTAFRPGWDPRGAPFVKGSEFESKFIQHIVRFRARSPFSAIAGVGDSFSSPLDLATSARNVMHLDVSSVPSIAAPMLEGTGLEATNSWMLDFMIHGKIKYLWEDNGINATKAWRVVNDFKEAVKKVSTALKVFCPPEDIVLKTFVELGDEIQKLHSGESGK